MKITFLGAAKTVTGSCYLVETSKCRFLIDCGMFQGSSEEEALNEAAFPFNPSEIDFILLTHAHIDHSGRIPKMFVDGFKNDIYATKATAELCSIMLPDSGHIQEFENTWINRKRKRAGKPPVAPIYTHQDAIDCLKLFKSVRYYEEVQVFDGVRARFNDAGHILGSSILELWIEDEGKEIKLVFSGDLGNKGIPILRDPDVIESADYLILESTYGNRVHKQKEDKTGRFLDIINETIEKGGNVVIPSFAVGRSQDIIYELNSKREKYDEKMKKFYEVPVYLDSPLAVSATEVFRNNLDCFDEEAREYIENGDNPLDFEGLVFTRSADESKALNEQKDSKIIISASGMCEAGRIKHHLKHNLWRKESTILFVGYQAPGTLGRRIVDGAKTVNIFGEEISVNARIEMIEGFSGHADRDGLLEWVGKFKKKPEKIFVVHGEEEVMNQFSSLLNAQFNIDTVIPSRGDTYSISAREHVKAVSSRITAHKKRKSELGELLAEIRQKVDLLDDVIRNSPDRELEESNGEKLYQKLMALEKSISEALK